MSKLRFFSAAAAAATLLAGGCRTPPPSVETPPRDTQGNAVTLPPASSTPRYGIDIEDPDEIALLTQRLKLQEVTAVRGTLYFAADGAFK